jgi:hypothetical protein
MFSVMSMRLETGIDPDGPGLKIPATCCMLQATCDILWGKLAGLKLLNSACELSLHQSLIFIVSEDIIQPMIAPSL